MKTFVSDSDIFHTRHTVLRFHTLGKDLRRCPLMIGYAGVKGTKRGKLQDARRREFEEEKSSFISILRRHAAYTNPSTSGRQEDRKKRKGRQERKRDTSRSSLQTHLKRAGLSGFPCSASRTHDTGQYTFAALCVSCAPGRSDEEESSRLILA